MTNVDLLRKKFEEDRKEMSEVLRKSGERSANVVGVALHSVYLSEISPCLIAIIERLDKLEIAINRSTLFKGGSNETGHQD